MTIQQRAFEEAGKAQAAHFLLVDKTLMDAQAAASALYLTVNQRVCKIVTTTAQTDFTIYLPPVQECAGLFFSFHLETLGDNEIVTLAHLDDAWDWGGDYTLDAGDDSIILYSDGFKWWTVVNEIA